MQFRVFGQIFLVIFPKKHRPTRYDDGYLYLKGIAGDFEGKSGKREGFFF